MNRPSPSDLPPFSGPGPAEDPTQRRIDPSHDALPPGTRFAEYELLSVLGEGRSGIVYLAMDHGLERQVAIKEYLPAALASRGQDMEVKLRSDGHAESFAAGLESFVNEARLLAHFDHPALMRVYRFWEANRTAYMAMPHYEGVTVDIARQSMAHPPDEAWLRGLLLPLLDALDVLHGASCYHWDISPEHILLQPDGRPVLLDSGALHVIGHGSQGTNVVLNPGFAPIEQYAESTQLRQGPWTDLYALAAVAYYCVSGYPPIASTVRALDDQLEPLSQIIDRLGRNFPQLNYSVALVSAIERALNVRPQERPQSVAEFRRVLLGGRGSAESVVVPPAVEATDSHEAPAPHQLPGQQTGSFQDVPPPKDPGSVGDSFRQHPEPGSPAAEPRPQAEPTQETPPEFVSPDGQTPSGGAHDADDPALWAAFESALGPDRDRFGEPRASRRGTKAGGWHRTLLMGGAALAFVALGAGGWMMWAEYRQAKVMQRFSAASTEPDRPRAPLNPPAPPATAPPAELPAQLPSSPAAEPQSPPPVAAMPEAAPPEPPPREAATAAEVPSDRSPPLTRLDNTLTKVDKEQNNPRVLCGTRTQFSLYRCMKTECERPKYYEHPECKYLRAKDEVRTLP